MKTQFIAFLILMLSYDACAIIPSINVDNELNKVDSPTSKGGDSFISSPEIQLSQGQLLQAKIAEAHREYNTSKHRKVKIDSGTDIASLEVAKELEDQFMGIMWNMAFKTVEVDPILGGGQGEEIMRSFLVENLVNEANKGELGPLGRDIYDNLKAKQME